jgi:hypothetical protein
MLKNDNGQAAADFYDRRRKWAEYLSTHPDISDRAFRVGYWLSRRMNGDDQCCWYSVARVAEELGRKPRYVRYALAELRAANVMVIIEKPGKANRYFIHAPFF